MIVGVWRLLHSNCTHALTDPYAPPVPSNPSAAEAGKLLPAAGSRSGDLSSCSEPPLASPGADRPRRTSQPGRHPHRRAIQPKRGEKAMIPLFICREFQPACSLGLLVPQSSLRPGKRASHKCHFGHPSTYSRLSARGLIFVFLLLRIDDGDCRPRLRQSGHRCVLLAVVRHACQWLWHPDARRETLTHDHAHACAFLRVQATQHTQWASSDPRMGSSNTATSTPTGYPCKTCPSPENGLCAGR